MAINQNACTTEERHPSTRPGWAHTRASTVERIETFVGRFTSDYQKPFFTPIWLVHQASGEIGIAALKPNGEVNRPRETKLHSEWTGPAHPNPYFQISIQPKKKICLSNPRRGAKNEGSIAVLFVSDKNVNRLRP